MDWRLVWTQKASEDVEAIVRYISRHNRNAAVEVGRGIFDRAQILLKHQQSGSILKELDDPFIRKVIYRNWKIVYQYSETEGVVAILRVWHVARGEVDL
ncbi:MAG: type II toxin-antitoxin system RelE/ParE family toxin [Verrucomicrobiota bacterium]